MKQGDLKKIGSALQARDLRPMGVALFCVARVYGLDVFSLPHESPYPCRMEMRIHATGNTARLPHEGHNQNPHRAVSPPPPRKRSGIGRGIRHKAQPHMEATTLHILAGMSTMVKPKDSLIWSPRSRNLQTFSIEFYIYICVSMLDFTCKSNIRCWILRVNPTSDVGFHV